MAAQGVGNEEPLHCLQRHAGDTRSCLARGAAAKFRWEMNKLKEVIRH
jgi:hypothetical protein